MQLKMRDFFIDIRSIPNEIKMDRICTSSVSCGSGEMENDATDGEFGATRIDIAPFTANKHTACTIACATAFQ